MGYTQEQIQQRIGRPLPPQLPLVADLLKGINEGLEKLGGKVSPPRYASVQTSLAGVLSNVNADLADAAKGEQIKVNQQKADDLAAAQKALTTAAAAGQ